MKPLRVLFINHFSVERCGEQIFNTLMFEALRKVGVDCVPWDGAYPAIYARGHQYLPETGTSEYDLIHLGWGPAQMGHYLPQHFLGSIPLSLFLHDIPPNSTCLLWDRAAVRFAFEPYPGVEVMDEPIPDYVPKSQPSAEISIGVTGIRSDPGHALVEALCKERGWRFNAPLWWTGDAFLSVEEEIERLATSTVNVCWYATTGRGKSMASQFCCAARRPLVVSSSSMFSALWPYAGREMGEGISVATPDADLSLLLDRVVDDAFPGVPWQIIQDLSWLRTAEKIKQRWEVLLEERGSR